VRRARVALVAVGAGLLFLAASYALPSLRSIVGSGLGGVPSYEVERGSFARRVHAEGNLQAVDATLLGPPPDARRAMKIAWLAAEGTLAKAGDVVIRFDPSELEEDLREGKSERATTTSRITQQEVREQGARANMQRDAELAGLELGYAESFQSKDAQIFSRNEIIESEIDKGLAQTKKEHAEKSSTIHHDLAQTELDLLAIERRKAELKIEQAESGLAALEVRAPHDGTFVHKSWWGRRPEVGQVVWGGNAIAEMPNLERMEALVYVLEADAGGLEVGLSATVSLDAHPGTVHPARVSQVAALAQRRNSSGPIQYFAVTLSLEQTDPRIMKPGQRVQAVIAVEDRADALTIPPQAVFEVEGKRVVYVADGGRFVSREVTLGPAALGRVVVERGLEPGERIALRNPTAEPEEQAVEARAEGSGPVLR
jgi:RND family efflux transporter MFP subunit